MEFGWIWVAIIVVSVLVEVFTDQLISIWFVPGALIGIVMDFFDIHFAWQILVCLVFAILGMFLFRRLLSKFIPDKSSKTNIEAIIGEKCIVTERIDNFAGCGQAKVKGQIWSARGISDDDIYEVGEVLNIVAIEGVKIICKKD